MEEWFEREFEQRIPELNFEASVGYCDLKYYGSTLGQALGWNGIHCDEQRLLAFKGMVKARIFNLLNEPQSDPIKVFVKQEPHKRSKLEEGRYRLISAVSAVDCFVDRMLFCKFTDIIMENKTSTPCWAGWNPYKGGYRQLWERFVGEETMSVDKSAWDWTCPGWLLYLCLKILLSMMHKAPEWKRTLVINRFICLFERPRFKFSDGYIIYQPDWGIMKSGCYLTLLLNSMCQSLLHYICNIKCGRNPLENSPICYGDDTLQRVFAFVVMYMEMMRRMGIRPKLSKPEDGLEFVGFKITSNSVVPEYEQKHVFALMHVDQSVVRDTLKSYQLLYAHNPRMLNMIQDNILSICPDEFVDEAVLKRWADGTLPLANDLIQRSFERCVA